MPTENLTLLGSGGQALVVLDALKVSGYILNITLCDHNPQKIGLYLAEWPIELAPNALNEFQGNIHVTIGNNTVRAQIYKALTNASFFSIIHSSAVISSTSEIGKGSFIAALSVLAPQCNIGEGCIINHGAVVDHEVTIGAYSHISPNSTLGGNVVVGCEVLIGAGAVILPGIKIGDRAIVGAGSVVTRNVAENSIVKGAPAK